uniref:Uncharacterized protein n=1 Tax=Romanomermis culicivorax TaxID=13658 RepID=A0A915JGZ5_ROMCU
MASLFLATTTDFDTYIDEITKDPNENAVTIPDDEKFSNFNRWLSQVAGLSVFLLICIVGLALLAISLLIIACHQVAKRRREQSMSTRTGHTAFQRSKLSLSHVSYKSKAASVKSLGPRTVSEKSAAKSLGPARTKSQKSAIASSKKPKTSVFKRLTNSRRKSNTDGILASMASKRPPSKRTR